MFLRAPRVSSFTHRFFSQFSPSVPIEPLGRCIPEKKLLVPMTRKRDLRELQEKFSPKVVGDYSKSKFAKEIGLYLYPNDWRDCYGWHDAAKPQVNQYSTTQDKNLALVFGNGNILSWAPEFPADVILLADCEPVLHYFLLSVRDLIVTADAREFSTEMRERLLEKIRELEMEIYTKNRGLHFDRELHKHTAGEYRELSGSHFLSSQARLIECQRALMEKEIIPLGVDAFNVQAMGEVSDIVKKAGRKFSYVNLTNLADYDTNETLFYSVCQLPFSEQNLQIISTSRNRNESSKHEPHRFYLSEDLPALQKAITQSHNLAMKNLLNYDDARMHSVPRRK